LELPPDSPLRAADPQYEGIKRFLLTLLLFYSKQSKSIRGANVVYDRITSQVSSPAMYDGTSSCSWANLFLFLFLGLCWQSAVYFAFALVPLSFILLPTKLKYAHFGYEIQFISWWYPNLIQDFWYAVVLGSNT
jgi:hypothetical protein